jgi:Co/Zn/Cd efflux system component
MLHLLLQAAADTASSVAHAANANQSAWSAEQWRDLIVGVIGALVAGFLAWQNKVIQDQNVAHEKRAQDRSAGVPPTIAPFPGEKR